MEKIAAGKNCSVIGKYECLGFDTFGPFKLVGGLQKGHPTGMRSGKPQNSIKAYNKAVMLWPTKAAHGS